MTGGFDDLGDLAPPPPERDRRPLIIGGAVVLLIIVGVVIVLVTNSSGNSNGGTTLAQFDQQVNAICASVNAQATPVEHKFANDFALARQSGNFAQAHSDLETAITILEGGLGRVKAVPVPASHAALISQLVSTDNQMITDLQSFANGNNAGFTDAQSASNQLEQLDLQLGLTKCGAINTGNSSNSGNTGTSSTSGNTGNTGNSGNSGNSG